MALVVVSYEADAKYRIAPVTVRAGEELRIGRRDDEWPGWVFCEDSTGRQGWIPEKYLKITGEEGMAEQDYTARELSAVEGEIVRVEKLESGWAWVTSMTDETGWIPIRNLKVVD
jgi:uncharacterized protein YgiM (DUF1202 family)